MKAWQKAVDSEPRYTNSVISELEMIKSLNWYGRNQESKQAIKYINDFLKKQKIPCGIDAVNKQINTFGFLCRMKNNGAVFSEKQDTKFKEYLDAMLALHARPVKVVGKKPSKPTVSIQTKLAEKVSEACGELEGAIDDYILSNFKIVPSPLAILHAAGIKAPQVKSITEWFKKRRAEFDVVSTTTDEQLIEGYSNFKKSELGKLVAWCDQVLTDCAKIASGARVSRKPRKRKVKSPDKLVSKINYCQSNDFYKLESVAPNNIIGAMQLWTFNTKYKRLSVYIADDAMGLSVKGTTLRNFSTAKSITKTLRKPEVTLKEVLTGGKVSLRNIMDNLTTRTQASNGRLNKETVLLRVIT